MRSISAVLVFLVLAMFAPGAQAAAGLNLRWNACFGDAGVSNRASACATNVGNNQLVGSFVTGVEFPQVDGIQIYIDLATSSSSLPAWWQFKNTGSCRATSLSMNGTI